MTEYAWCVAKLLGAAWLLVFGAVFVASLVAAAWDRRHPRGGRWRRRY